MSKKVALLLSDDFSDQLEGISKQMPTWVIDGARSVSVVEALRARGNFNYPITVFFGKEGEERSDCAERLVGTVDEHHNDTADGGGYEELLVFGLPISDLKKEAFLENGFEEFQQSDFGFIARKKPCIQDQ